MKNVITVLSLAFLMGGCATTTNGVKDTPAQMAEKICPPVQITLETLKSLNGVSEQALVNIDRISPIVGAACTAGENVNISDLKSIAMEVIPVAIAVVKVSSLSAEDQNKMLVGLAAAQVILSSIK